MELTAGQRLKSAACATEVVVVKAPSQDVDLRCGGVPMLDPASEPSSTAVPKDGYAEPTQIGKRYESEELGLEVLVTKPGAGSLSVAETRLHIKAAKALPSSD